MQVVCHAANQRRPIGLGSRFQPGFLQTFEDEGVDRCFDPGFVRRGSKCRRNYVFSGLKRPVTALGRFVGSERSYRVIGRQQQRGCRDSRKKSFHVDPDGRRISPCGGEASSSPLKLRIHGRYSNPCNGIRIATVAQSPFKTETYRQSGYAR